MRVINLPASGALSHACSNERVSARRLPDWWPYPTACEAGHAWSPGKVIVSWRVCDCQGALAYQERGAGHLVVHCAEQGCNSAWYKPRHGPSLAELAGPGFRRG